LRNQIPFEQRSSIEAMSSSSYEWIIEAEILRPLRAIAGLIFCRCARNAARRSRAGPRALQRASRSANRGSR